MAAFVDDEVGYRPASRGLPAEQPDAPDVLSAAFRQSNSVVSSLRFLQQDRFAPVDGYSAIDDLKTRNPDMLRTYGDRFLSSYSPAQTDQTIANIEQERRDKQDIESAGWAGTIAGITAGTVDAWTFLPVGAGAKAGAAGFGAMAAARTVGKAALMQTAGQEALLLASQETRTPAEAALNVASATLLGGMLGMGAYALLAREGILAKGADALDSARARLSKHNGMSRDAVQGDSVSVEGGNVVPFPAPEKVTTSPDDGIPVEGRSVGAAYADTRDLSPVPYGLEKTGIGKLWPNTRVLERGVDPAKRAVTELSEVPITLEHNVGGGTSTLNGGPAVDREVKIIREGLHAQADDMMMQQWGQHLNDGQEGTPTFMQRTTGNGAPGKMTFDEFDAAVYDALSTGDVHENPQVTAAAQWLRQNGFEPIKSRASAITGFAETATRPGETYAPRIWNKELISAKWNEFVGTWTEHLVGDQARKAALKADIEVQVDALNKLEDQQAKWDAMLERLDTRQTELSGRLDERAMELDRGEKRLDTLADRASILAEETREVRQFIAELRSDIRDPVLHGRLDVLEREVAALNRADRPVTEADLAKLDAEEAKGVLRGDTRRAAEMLVGRRSFPKTPSFVSWIMKQGGIKGDSAGAVEVLESLDRKSWHGRRIINNKTGRTLEDLADKVTEEFPNALGAMDANRARPTVDQMLRWIDDAAHGREPDFFLENHPNKANLNAAHQAAMLDEMFQRNGVEVKTVRDVADVLKGNNRQGVTLEDLIRTATDMEAAGERIPLALRRGDAEERLAVTRDEIAALRKQLEDALTTRDAQGRRMQLAEAAGAEAALAERASRGRLRILDEQMAAADHRRDILELAQRIAEQSHADLRAKIEAKLEQWGGKSAREAVSAIKARTKAEDLRAATQNIRAGAGLPVGEAGRLTSADKAVDRAVKRILASDRDLSPQELRSRAEEIASRMVGTPDGRLPYDVTPVGDGGPADELRGHAAHRQIDIPYDMAKPWLDRSATKALNSYTRSVLPDAILAERFGGDPNLTAVMKDIESAYATKRAAAKSEKEQERLKQQMDSDIEVVAGMRDRIRGTFAYDPSMAGLATFSQRAIKISNITSSHMMAVASIPDLAGVVFRHGLESAFKDAWLPFARAMMNSDGWAALKAQGAEWKAFGLGIETHSAARQHELSGIVEDYRPTSKFDRAITWASDKAFILNLLAPLTDVQKRMAANVASHNILRASRAVAEGNATAKQITMLGSANITEAQAAKIWDQWSNNGGADVKGVLLPNTAQWTDAEAKRAFIGAVARDVDIAVVTPGQEKPLFMSKPGFNMLAQYKAFSISATQRVLVANLQRRDASALTGAIMAMGLGMISYRLNTFASGQKTSDRVQDWVKEGISRGGVLGIIDDGNTVLAKSTAGKLDVHRIYGADKPLSRFASRDAAGIFLGPTWGKVQALTKISGALASSEKWSEADTHAVRMLAFGSNLPYLPQLFEQVEKGVNGAFGIPMKAKPN